MRDSWGKARLRARAALGRMWKGAEAFRADYPEEDDYDGGYPKGRGKRRGKGRRGRGLAGKGNGEGNSGDDRALTISDGDSNGGDVVVGEEFVIVGEGETEDNESSVGGAEAIHHSVIDSSEGSEDGAEGGGAREQHHERGHRRKRSSGGIPHEGVIGKKRRGSGRERVTNKRGRGEGMDVAAGEGRARGMAEQQGGGGSHKRGRRDDGLGDGAVTAP